MPAPARRIAGRVVPLDRVRPLRARDDATPPARATNDVKLFQPSLAVADRRARPRAASLRAVAREATRIRMRRRIVSDRRLVRGTDDVAIAHRARTHDERLYILSFRGRGSSVRARNRRARRRGMRRVSGCARDTSCETSPSTGSTRLVFKEIITCYQITSVAR